MTDLSVLEAVQDGTAEYQWATIQTGPLVLRVFADALKVGGVRVNVSAREAQLVADELGAMLTTPEIEDLIYERAEVRVPAYTGSPESRTDAQHSRDIDAALEVLRARSGQLVATVGKSWVLSNKATRDRAVNYGWHDPGAKYDPVSPRLVSAKVRVWQPEASAHNLEHRDYSQTLRLVSNECTLNGKVESLGVIMRHPLFCGLVTRDGPIKNLRQPGVALLAEEKASTIPAMDPTSNANASLGEMCALWCEHQARTVERPGAALVASWLKVCERNGKPLGITKGNHCAAAQSAALRAMKRDGDKLPHGYRAAAKELMADAGSAGTWREATLWREGDWSARVGDLAVYDRSVPGRPETSWWGHVDRVVVVDDQKVTTLGANEGPQGEWRRETLTKDHPRLLGFVEYPRAGASSLPREAGEVSAKSVTAGVYSSPMDALAVSLGRTVDDGLAEMREHGWAPRDGS